MYGYRAHDGRHNVGYYPANPSLFHLPPPLPCSGYDTPLNATDKPDARLVLEHVYGYRAHDGRHNIGYVGGATAAAAAAAKGPLDEKAGGRGVFRSVFLVI